MPFLSEMCYGNNSPCFNLLLTVLFTEMKSVTNVFQLGEKKKRKKSEWCSRVQDVTQKNKEEVRNNKRKRTCQKHFFFLIFVQQSILYVQFKSGCV